MFPMLRELNVTGKKCVWCNFAFRSSLPSRNIKFSNMGVELNGVFSTKLDTLKKYTTCSSCHMKIDYWFHPENFQNPRVAPELDHASYEASFEVNWKPDNMREVIFSYRKIQSGYPDVVELNGTEVIPAIPNSLGISNISMQRPGKTESSLPLELDFVDTETPLVKVDGCYVTAKCIMELLSSGNNLSSLVLETALSRLIDRRNAAASVERKNSKRCPDRFILVSLSYMKFVSSSEYSVNTLFAPKNFKTKTLVIPICSNKHMYLSIFYMRKKEIHVFDSLWDHVPCEYMVDHVKCFLESLTAFRTLQTHDIANCKKSGSCKDQWHLISHRDCSQQNTNVSCGFFTFNFAKNVVMGESHRNNESVTIKDLLVIRQEVMSDLLSTTELGKTLLSTLSTTPLSSSTQLLNSQRKLVPY